MDEIDFWGRFVLGILATWRVTYLLAREDGPADLIVRFRARLGQGVAGRLMDCFSCLCLWIAAPAALYVTREPLDWGLCWLAISGAACLLERAVEDPVVIQPMPQATQGDGNYGMLRPETGRSQERPGGGGHTG